MDVRSPKFGMGHSAKPASPPFYDPPIYSRSISGRRGRDSTPPRLPMATPDAFPDSDHDADRTELSMGLSARYMQLREEITTNKRDLRDLRDEYARKKEVLKGLLEASKEEDASRARVRELSTALSNISSIATDDKPDVPALKLDVIRKHLRGIAQWNQRVNALLVFLEAQQQPVAKKVAAVRPKSRSPARTHWSP